MLLSELEKVLQIGKFLILSQEFLIFFGKFFTKGLGEKCHGEAWLFLDQVVSKRLGMRVALVKLLNRESIEEAWWYRA